MTGTVASVAPAKTLIVVVERTLVHPKYGKRMKRQKRYAVHNEAGVFAVGDVVLFETCRPMSRTKRWRVVEKVTKS
ncbi:30S ribosomal protein S17 [Candidatus Uhrbacteria bacterium]|nr:30S ribosomal protein S17 [Candidatus Uhrbacteria bacterium]